MKVQDIPEKIRQAMPFDSLLAQSRDLACTRLSQALVGMLDKAGESLAEIISGTQDTEQKKIYTEVQDTVRRQRKAMEDQFRIQYLKEFEARRNQINKTSQRFSDLNLSTLQLELVGDDELKETLKVADMANKLRRYCEEELGALDQRVGVLLGDANLGAEDNPFCPLAICDAYKLSCRDISPKSAVRMALLKLFDDHVLDEIRSVYKGVNALLVQNSILPKIRFVVSRSQESGKPSSPGAQAGNGGAPTNPPDGSTGAPGAEQDFFAVLQKMLSSNTPGALQAGVPGAGGIPAGISGIPGFPTLAGVPSAASGETTVVLQGAELMNLLTRVQHDRIRSATQDSQAPAETMGAVNVLRELKTTSLSAGMNQLDNMTLDIIAMLFDQLFDDPKIPIAVKGLIGRMQICFLKVAIADKEFFSRKTHPARRMLDSLGNVSLRLPSDFAAANPLFGSLETIIQEILDGFEDNVGIFDSARERLEHLLDDEDQRVARDTQSATERIKQAESMAISKVNVQSEIRARILGHDLPLLLRGFLMQEWVKVLLVVHAQRGPGSEIWKNALSAMDQLIWSVRTDHTAEECLEVAKVVPVLLRRLAAGLKIGGVDDAVCERFFSLLKPLHDLVINSEVTDQVARHPASACIGLAKCEVVTVEKVAPPSLESTQPTPKPRMPATAPTPAPPSSAESEESDSLDFTEVMTIKNPFGEGKVEVKELDFSDLSMADTKGKPKYTEFINNLKVGTWVEFREKGEQVEQDKARPAKLSYASPLRTQFLFVDRLGKTVVECSRIELAIQFNLGKIAVMGEVSLFDRIMKAVVGKMRQPVPV